MQGKETPVHTDFLVYKTSHFFTLRQKQSAEESEDINEVLIAEDEAEEKFDPVALEKELAELENQQYLTPTEVRRHLRLVWDKEGHVLAKVFKSLELHVGHVPHPSDVFFIDIMPVPPARFRPVCRICFLWFILKIGSRFIFPRNT